jgi:chondroitin AC lyase
MQMKVFFTFIVGFMLACSSEIYAASNPDIELLRTRFISELLEPAVHETAVKEIMHTLRADGTWPGIDYADTTRTAFQHTRHLYNLVQMCRAYKKKGSPLAGKKELKQAISLALDYWLKHDFICENWWNNEIGTPTELTAVLLIMDKDLSKEQTAQTSAITARAHINAWGARQSGDRIKIAGIQAKNALFKRDVDLFEMLVKVIEGEIRIVTDNERGIQVDYSFHHRTDRVNNTLSYGLGYAETFVEWASKLADTRYRFSEKSQQLLIDYYLDGICKMMIYGKYPDPGATNRDIARPHGGDGAFSPRTPERLISLTAYRKSELEEIAKIRRNEVQVPSSFSVFYWQSEHYTHQRPGYFTSVRMFSTRNYNMEEPYNGEGLLNHHRGDGSNYISLKGDEYFALSPVYDWQKIPGTTVLQKSALPPETAIQKPGVMDCVGAVTDGKYGAVGFDFISPHDPVKARKAWFFFDDAYVCLGAGITSGTNNPVVTTLNQTRLAGDVWAGTGEREMVLPKGEHAVADKSGWVFHNGTGYIFPEPAHIVLYNQAQTGSWRRINRQTSSSHAELVMDVFKLWIDHGVRARNAEYQYIVMPASTKDKVKAAAEKPNVKILANTPVLQAVWHNELHILQAVFYKNGEITFADGLKVALDSPGILMIKQDGGNIKEISVADPLRKSGKLHLSINKKLDVHSNQARTVWNEQKGVSEISVDLPQELFAGKSVTLIL